MRDIRIAVRIRQSFWFLPAIYGIASILLAILAAGIDLGFQISKTGLPKYLMVDRSLGMKLFSTLMQSVLTMTTITFSTIMVVLTTFTSQFSPRALQNFMADGTTQRVLAIFVSGVIYNLIALFMVRPSPEKLFVSSLLAILIAMFAVAAFVYFINHVAKWVQVNKLINRLTNDLMGTIERVNQGVVQYQDQSQASPDEITEPDGQKHVITAEYGGYIGLINFGALVRQAEKDDAQLCLHVHIGDFVVEGVELLSYWTKTQNIDEQKYHANIKLEDERTEVQDIEFGIQKLVEIALRAISPSTNDPHTAINCINRIGTLLVELGNRAYPSPYLYDSKNQWRVKIQQFDFDHYLYKAFYQIRHYAESDVSVTTSILYNLKLIAAKSPANVGQSVRAFASYIYEGFNKDVLLPLDEEYINKEMNELMAITGGRSQEKQD